MVSVAIQSIILYIKQSSNTTFNVYFNYNLYYLNVVSDDCFIYIILLSLSTQRDVLYKKKHAFCYISVICATSSSWMKITNCGEIYKWCRIFQNNSEPEGGRRRYGTKMSEGRERVQTWASFKPRNDMWQAKFGSKYIKFVATFYLFLHMLTVYPQVVTCFCDHIT